MARLPYVRSSSYERARGLIDRIKQERGGRLLNLYQVLLNSPEVADGWLHLLTAIRQKCRLADRIRELVILRVAVLNGADYEFFQHVPHARSAGLGETEIEALRAERPGDPLTDADRAVLALVDAMTREVRVPESVFRSVSQLLEPQEMTELIVTIAAYNMVSRVLEAVQVDRD